MFGLLSDDEDKQQAQRAGLLNFGAALLASQSPNLGSALGSGLALGAQGYQGSIERQRKQALQDMELQQKKRLFEMQGALLGEMGAPAPSGSFAALQDGAQSGSVGPTVANASRMQQNPAPQSSGPSMETLSRAAVLGMPGVDTLFQIQKYRKDGVKRDAGAFYEVDGRREYIPDPSKGIGFENGVVQELPGAASTLAKLKGAEARATEGAKADFTPLPIGYVGADGRPLGGTVGQYVTAQRQQPEGLDISKLSPRNIAFLQQQDPQAFARGVERFARTSSGPALLQSEAEKVKTVGDIQVDQAVKEARAKAEPTPVETENKLASFDTMLSTLNRLSQHPGLPTSVGIYSKLPTIPGSKSATFQAELETFQSQAFLPMVAQLKGTGQLSDAEGKKLTAAVGALNPNMGEQAFRDSIGRIIKDMEAARNRVARPTGGFDMNAIQRELERRKKGQ